VGWGFFFRSRAKSKSDAKSVFLKGSVDGTAVPVDYLSSRAWIANKFSQIQAKNLANSEL
jgi:hypothetical protein